jgi:hypothetical protein
VSENRDGVFRTGIPVGDEPPEIVLVFNPDRVVIVLPVVDGHDHPDPIQVPVHHGRIVHTHEKFTRVPVGGDVAVGEVMHSVTYDAAESGDGPRTDAGAADSSTG